MKKVTNILKSGLAIKGNSFKISLNELIIKSEMNQNEVCIALNSITQWNAWEMISK